MVPIYNHAHSGYYSYSIIPKENIVDEAANVDAQGQHLAVDTVQDGFQQIALARVLAVKQVQQLQS